MSIFYMIVRLRLSPLIPYQLEADGGEGEKGEEQKEESEERQWKEEGGRTVNK